MKLNLTYYLKRKKTDLKTFLKINRLTSYEQLVEFCKLRSFIPISKDDFEKEIKPPKPPIKNETKKKQTRRKSSKAQKKQTVRRNSKTTPNSRNISTSSDKKQD